MRKLVIVFVILGVLLSAGLLFAEEQEPPVAPAPSGAQNMTTQPAPAAAPSSAPARIDTGDTAWMIVATALVMLMSIPGLALFYGGLSKRKDSLNTMAMTFVTFCIASVLWVLYGYSFSFGTDIGGFIGS